MISTVGVRILPRDKPAEEGKRRKDQGQSWWSTFGRTWWGQAKRGQEGGGGGWAGVKEKDGRGPCVRKEC